MTQDSQEFVGPIAPADEITAELVLAADGGLENFWREYDLVEQDNLLAVFKIAFDLAGMIDENNVRYRIRKAAYAVGWSRERVEQIEGWAASSCNFASNAFIAERLEGLGLDVCKVKGWAV